MENMSPNNIDFIFELLQRYSRGTLKAEKGVRDILTRVRKTSSNGITIANIEKKTRIFLRDILNSLSSQLNRLHMNKKKREVELYSAIFFPKYRRKYSWRNLHWITLMFMKYVVRKMLQENFHPFLNYFFVRSSPKIEVAMFHLSKVSITTNTSWHDSRQIIMCSPLFYFPPQLWMDY